MVLHAYGDSWTEGEGADTNIELTLKNQQLTLFRNKHSWVKHLADELKCEWVNNGKSGNPNSIIFNSIIDDVTTGRVKRGDLVGIMWSSSLRDYAAFLPRQQWVSWSVKHLINRPDKFINSYQSNNESYDYFLRDYKNFFLENLFNQNYYNIVNQNYIIFLQKLLQNYNIKYLMCDAFETMVNELHPKDDVTTHINKKAYWKFGEKCFKQFLIETKMNDIWEPIEISKQDVGGIHPNKKGYEIICEELYNYLKKENYV